MDDLSGTVERLTARLESLELRVCALEHPSEASSPKSAPQPPLPQIEQPGEDAPFAQAAGAFSVLGKAMLGIAGAYLLRAVAEMSSLPRLAVAAVAVAYALLWLVWAVRVKSREWLASSVYASTSALILAPLLWELTLRFKLLPAAATAGLLCAFVAAATALAWNRDSAPVFWVANVAAALAALALAFATHNMLPFLLSLLAMVVLCELAAHCGRESSVRPFLALAADLGVWGLVFIYSGPPNARVDYQQIGTTGLLAPGCLIFLIFATTVVCKALLRQERISVFEIGQTIIAFLLAAASLLYFLPASGGAVAGGACLFLSAAGYVAAFAFLDRQPDPRNYHIFAFWSAALFLAGCLCLPADWQAMALGLAAVAASAVGFRLSRLTLAFDGLFFLAGAAAISGLPAYVFNALAGAMPASPAFNVYLVTACAIACYSRNHRLAARRRGLRWLHIFPAALAVCGLAALLVHGLLWLVTLRISPDVFHVAFIRTLTTCFLALALAYCGSRWQRAELNWIAYATLFFVAAKLVFEDLRHGHMEFIAASIFLYAVTLIALPRLARLGQKP